jgi:hypothetical protein
MSDYLGAASLPDCHLEPISTLSATDFQPTLGGWDGLFLSYAQQPLPVRGCH